MLEMKELVKQSGSQNEDKELKLSEFNRLQTENKELTVFLDQIRCDVSHHRNKSKRFEEDLALQTKAAEELRKVLEKKDEKLERLNEDFAEFSRIKAENEELTVSLNQARCDVSSFQNEARTNGEDLSVQTKAVEELRKILQTKDEKLKELNKDFAKFSHIKVQNEELIVSLGKAHREVSSLQ